MPPCTPPRGASRNGARAAARSSRLAAACVLLLLLVVAAAAVPAHAVDAGDTSPVCADTSCYTREQYAATSTALNILRAGVRGLEEYWGFFNTSNFCVYPGVTCRKSGITVVASSLQLTGWLPEVTDLRAPNSVLVSLDLSNNSGIVGTVPASWSKYTALRRFVMSGTSVRGSLPSGWSALSQLQTLLLNETLVSGTVPESWGALSSLRKLDLSGTSITGCLPRALVEKNGLTEAGVGLTSAWSQNCRSTPRPSSSGNSPDWMIPVAVVALWWSSALLW